MTDIAEVPVTDSAWRGTSEAPATILRRANTNPTERWTTLAELVEFAGATGALARARQRKQAHLDAWAAGTA